MTSTRLHCDIYVERGPSRFVVIFIWIFTIWDVCFFHLHLGHACLSLLNSRWCRIIRRWWVICLGWEKDRVCSASLLWLVCSLRGGRAFLLFTRTTCRCRRCFGERLVFGRLWGGGSICLFWRWRDQIGRRGGLSCLCILLLFGRRLCLVEVATLPGCILEKVHRKTQRLHVEDVVLLRSDEVSNILIFRRC